MQSLSISLYLRSICLCVMYKFDAKIRLFRHIWFIELIWNGIAPSMTMQMAPQHIQNTQIAHCIDDVVAQTIRTQWHVVMTHCWFNIMWIYRMCIEFIIGLFICWMAHTHTQPRSFVSLHLIRIWKQSRYEYVAKCVN